MTTDWIRPAGCESGSCVEIRTFSDGTAIRHSDEPEHVIVFKSAEWDAFVAGLVAEQLAEAEDDRDFHAAHADRIADIADHIAAANRRNREAKEALATENARLRQRVDTLERSLTDSACEVESLRAFLHSANQRIEEVEGMVAVLQRSRDALRNSNRDLLKQRNAAVAEAAVLRLKVRRMQDVADQAITWFRKGGNFFDFHAAVLAYRKGQEAAPESTESAEQPPGEAMATDGAGAQGEAQGAVEAFWRWLGDLHDRIYSGGTAFLEHFVPAARVDPASTWVDVTDRIRADARATEATFTGTPTATMATGVVKVTMEDGIQVALDGLHGQEKRRADLAEREAGRAGEAQEQPWTQEQVDRINRRAEEGADRMRPFVRDAKRPAEAQERTEGLDAAIEAACAVRYGASWPTADKVLAAGWRSDMAEILRAASPLIERAALLAAADEIRSRLDQYESTYIGLVEAVDMLERRAGRTGGA